MRFWHSGVPFSNIGVIIDRFPPVSDCMDIVNCFEESPDNLQALVEERPAVNVSSVKEFVLKWLIYAFRRYASAALAVIIPCEKNVVLS